MERMYDRQLFPWLRHVLVVHSRQDKKQTKSHRICFKKLFFPLSFSQGRHLDSGLDFHMPLGRYGLGL